MLAFAVYLIKQGAAGVQVHPDGEHAKVFDMPAWFKGRQFVFAHAGGPLYAGAYSSGDVSITIKSRAGIGDVVASVNGRNIIAECKGGVINSNHAGQKSRLRRGLCEVIGLLMAREQGDDRHIAVVPRHPETERLARRMRERVKRAGIEIALVDGTGAVQFI